MRKQDYLVLSLSFEAADEVDKSSDNQIFLSFLGLLREKYLKCQQGKDVTFHSVILAGVYDIKTLKLKLHPQEESKYNSLWNIADNNQMYMKVSSDRNQYHKIRASSYKFLLLLQLVAGARTSNS